MKNVKGSDFLHWGEAQISISKEKIICQSNLSPERGNKLYLTKTFVTDEERFLKKKNKKFKIGTIHSLNEFLHKFRKTPSLERNNSVVIWY